MMAFVFPGQGTQWVGMAGRFIAASSSATSFFDRAGSALGRDLREICTHGPLSLLTATENAQPALFTTNAAALEIALERGMAPAAVAGHSVGEMSALYAAGVLDFDLGLACVQRRARLMTEGRTKGRMIAVIGLDRDRIEQICDEARTAGPVCVALHNSPQHYVCSGTERAIKRVKVLAESAKALRIVPLKAEHAFHSPLMDDVANEWEKYVAGLPLQAPKCPIALNSMGTLTTELNLIETGMVQQVNRPVRWIECIEALLSTDSLDRIVEVGDSKVLSRFTRAINDGVRTTTVADLRSLDRLARSIVGGHHEEQTTDVVS